MVNDVVFVIPAHELFKFKVKPRNLLAELECYHARYQCSEQGKIVEKLNADLLARLLKVCFLSCLPSLKNLFLCFDLHLENLFCEHFLL